MGPKVRAVIDAGPIIHLRELGLLRAFNPFELFTVPLVFNEVKVLPSFISVEAAFDGMKADLIAAECGLGLAESQCMALAKKKEILLFLTDDLDARTTAEALGLEPHGTIGILLKAYRKGLFSRKEVVRHIQSIPRKSTLYITQEIIEYVVREIKRKR
ncbi:MAG: hypothetical protein HY393_03935 [Candidatus Diapherotrites archaeon]|nr:hypothetical protein [Candidatus Diapherotrites archaeon]